MCNSWFFLVGEFPKKFLGRCREFDKQIPYNGQLCRFSSVFDKQIPYKGYIPFFPLLPMLFLSLYGDLHRLLAGGGLGLYEVDARGQGKVVLSALRRSRIYLPSCRVVGIHLCDALSV